MFKRIFGSKQATPHRLYVGNIDFRMGREEIEEMFSEAGEVIDIYFPANKVSTRPHRGYIFIEMATAEQTLDAIKLFHQGFDNYDRQLIVRLADIRRTNTD